MKDIVNKACRQTERGSPYPDNLPLAGILRSIGQNPAFREIKKPARGWIKRVAAAWEHVMPEYRIFELDDKGHLSAPPSIGIWKDDIEAQMNARTLLAGRAFEIWCGPRKVATIKPDL